METTKLILEIIIAILLAVLVLQKYLSNKRDKITFSYSKRFDESQLDQFYRTIQKYLETKDLEISDEELQLINTSEELRYSLNMVFNFFEDLATAYNMGLLDKKYAIIAFSEPIFYIYKRYYRRIEYVRNESGDPSMMNQLEKAYYSMKKYKERTRR